MKMSNKEAVEYLITLSKLINDLKISYTAADKMKIAISKAIKALYLEDEVMKRHGSA